MLESSTTAQGARVAIVTGAGRGLGQFIAAGLHGAGYKVAVTDRNVDDAQAAARALDESGATAFALKLDVAHKSDFEAALQEVKSRWGALHVAVNNAAVTLSTPIMQITPEEFEDVLRINLRGTFLGCQVFGAAMAEAGHGRLINMASLAGQNGGTASGAHYASSKAGILTLTKIFARDLAARGVTCNAVAPGPLDLPLVHQMVPAERLQKMVDEVIPVKRLGDPRFIASMVVQLASPEAASVTGAAWDANGGIFMR